MANDLSQQQLIELLDYHPDTGKFYWKPRRVESFRAGNKSQKANHQSKN